MPSHGKELIDAGRSAGEGSALHDQKVSAADAAKRIDMIAHKAHYLTINGPGVNLPAVSRMYDVMEHRADQ